MRARCLLAAAIASAWLPAAAAEPVRLGEDDLGDVAIEADIDAAALAIDWLRAGFWLYDPQLTRRLEPMPTLRPSRPSRPQTVQAFNLSLTEE